MTDQMQIFRVAVLPEALVPNSMYLCRDAVSGKLTITGVDANGVVGTTLNSTDVLALISANVPEVSG